MNNQITGYQYKQISVGLHPDDFDKLEVVSQRLRLSRSAFIRELLHLYLNKVQLEDKIQ